MANYQLSYDFANIKRDLSEAYTKLVASQPTLIGRIRVGSPATQTKHEWLEEQLNPTSSAITSFDVNGDGTGVNVASTAGFTAGDIVRVTTSTGATRTEVMRITSVDSSTDLTVSRDYGGSTGVTLDVGDILVLMSSPKNEGTDPAVTKGTGEASVVFNYSQIDDEVAKVSKTLQVTGAYGISNALNDAVERKMLQLVRKQNSALIYGRKVARDASNAGSAGGILQFLEGGNVTAVGGALSSAAINNSFEAIFDDGAFSNNYMLVCAENQARKISAFNTSGTNPVSQRAVTDRTTGGYVTTFISDLGAVNGFAADVFVDPNFPKDQLAILDMNRIEVNYLRPLADEDATLPGGDYFQRRMLHEYTFTIRDGARAHALLTGLTL